MTLALLLLIAGLWLSWVSRPRPRPKPQPRWIVEIEVRRLTQKRVPRAPLEFAAGGSPWGPPIGPPRATKASKGAPFQLGKFSIKLLIIFNFL
jgi:hypothetical protein